MPRGAANPVVHPDLPPTFPTIGRSLANEIRSGSFHPRHANVDWRAKNLSDVGASDRGAARDDIGRLYMPVENPTAFACIRSRTSTQRPSRDATCNRVASSWTFRTGLVLEGPLRMLTASMTSTHSLSSSAATDGELALETGANSVSCAGAKFTPANSEVGNLPVFAAASGSEIDRCSDSKLAVKSGELKAVLAREKASAQTPQAAKLMRPEAIPYRALLLMGLIFLDWKHQNSESVPALEQRHRVVT